MLEHADLAWRQSQANPTVRRIHLLWDMLKDVTSLESAQDCKLESKLLAHRAATRGPIEFFS